MAKKDIIPVKGSSWNSYAQVCRSAFRGWRHNNFSIDNSGFRIVLRESTND